MSGRVIILSQNLNISEKISLGLGAYIGGQLLTMMFRKFIKEPLQQTSSMYVKIKGEIWVKKHVQGIRFDQRCSMNLLYDRSDNDVTVK